MSKLLYSTAAGDIAVNRQSLAAVPTPEPMGQFHKPIPFAEHVEVVEKSLDRHGLRIASEEFAVTKGQDSFFGVIEVEAKEGQLITADEWRMLIGLRGSHNQRIPAGMVVGSQVMVCSNLCFSGSVGNWSTRQTTNAWDRMIPMIDDSVDRIHELADEQERRVVHYKEKSLSPRAGDALLMDMMRKDILSGSMAKRAQQEWDEPTYPEHAADGFNAWRLLNAVTEAQKPSGNHYNPNQIANRTVEATRMLDYQSNFETKLAA